MRLVGISVSAVTTCSVAGGQVLLLLLAITVCLGPALSAQQDAAVARSDSSVLAGRCVDADGQPVSRAKIEIYLRDHRNHRTDLVRATMADAEGHFRVTGLQSLGVAQWGRMFHYVVGHAQGRSVAIATVRRSKVPAEDLRLVFGDPATVTGTVMDEQGGPIAGARVWVLRLDKVPGAPDYNSVFTSEPLPRLQTRTEHDGSFELAGLPSGAGCELFVAHPRFAKTRIRVGVPDQVEIVVRPGATIVGSVVMPDGKPAAHVHVQTQGVDLSSWATTRTDADGRYRLESMPLERYSVWVDKKGWTVKALDSFKVMEGEVAAPDLVLVKGGFIVGTVVDAATGKRVRPGPTSAALLAGLRSAARRSTWR